MKRDKVLFLMNVMIPMIGIGLMIFYEVCDTSCSYLQGTFGGIDLKVIGILFMAALLILSLPPASHYVTFAGTLRTMMLSGAMGGELQLVRFQILHDTYCPFCLAFGLCILVLFSIHFVKMNRYLALASFIAGIGAFALLFEGSVLPQY